MNTSEPPAVITTHRLTKRFGRVSAVEDVDLRVPEGSRFGLLGPNGSGKTTLVRLLLGLVHPTSGSWELLGRPMPRSAAQVLPRIGALVEEPSAWGHLSGRTNLRMIDDAGRGRSRRTRNARVEDALERVGLGGIDRRPVRAYSLGMRQRLGIAAALLRKPELLLLDEPTNGLDPRGINEVRELFGELNSAGTTIVLSSHLLTEVDALCTRVGVMDRGRLVLDAELAALRAPTGRVLLRTPDRAKAMAVLDGRVESAPPAIMPLGAEADLVVRHDDAGTLNAQLVAAGVRVTALSTQRRSLEQVMFEITGSGSDRVAGPDDVAGPGNVAGAGR